MTQRFIIGDWYSWQDVEYRLLDAVIRREPAPPPPPSSVSVSCEGGSVSLQGFRTTAEDAKRAYEAKCGALNPVRPQ